MGTVLSRGHNVTLKQVASVYAVSALRAVAVSGLAEEAGFGKG